MWEAFFKSTVIEVFRIDILFVIKNTSRDK
jgi:hypothetical protein